MSELNDWVDQMRQESEAWYAANPAGSKTRPWVVDAVRRLCLVRTDAGEWGVVEHGGWTETPGEAVNSFTGRDIAESDWLPSEAEARAEFAMSAGKLDRAKLRRLVAAHLDELRP